MVEITLKRSTTKKVSNFFKKEVINMNKKNIVLILLICIVLFPHNTKATENGWVNKDGYQYYYENNEMLKGI